MWLEKLVYPQSPLNWNCLQTLAVQLGIFADWCLFVSIKGRIKEFQICTEVVVHQVSLCAVWKFSSSGCWRYCRVSLQHLYLCGYFNKLELICISQSPAFYYLIEWVSCCLWLSGFVFWINAVEEYLERRLCPRTNNSDNGACRLLHIRVGRFLACLQLSQHSSFA